MRSSWLQPAWQRPPCLIPRCRCHWCASERTLASLLDGSACPPQTFELLHPLACCSCHRWVPAAQAGQPGQLGGSPKAVCPLACLLLLQLRSSVARHAGQRLIRRNACLTAGCPNGAVPRRSCRRSRPPAAPPTPHACYALVPPAEHIFISRSPDAMADAIPGLLDRLSGDGAEDQRQAARQLGDLARTLAQQSPADLPQLEPAVPLLVGLLSTNSLDSHVAAARALARLSRAAPDLAAAVGRSGAAPALAEMLRSATGGEAQGTAAEALVGLRLSHAGRQAAAEAGADEAVVNCWRNSDHEMVRYALQMMLCSVRARVMRGGLLQPARHGMLACHLLVRACPCQS